MDSHSYSFSFSGAKSHAASAPAPQASATLTEIAMQRDTLRSIFKFANLPKLISYSQVCRTWQSVAHSMPHLKALRQASQLNIIQLAQLTKAMEDLGEMRKANDPVKLKTVFSNARQHLRSSNCMAVAGPLLNALKSAQIIRKTLRKRTWAGEPGDVWISFKLPSNGSTSASVKQPIVSATVHVSWLLEVQMGGGHMSSCSWNFHEKGFGTLFSVYQERYDNRALSESRYETAGLVNWMRQSGLMGEGASPRQQFELALNAIWALFKLAGAEEADGYSESLESATGYEQESHWPQEAAVAAIAARNELPEPPISVEEQADEREGQRQLEEHMRLGTVFMSDHVNDNEHVDEERNDTAEEEAEMVPVEKAPTPTSYVFKFG